MTSPPSALTLTLTPTPHPPPHAPPQASCDAKDTFELCSDARCGRCETVAFRDAICVSFGYGHPRWEHDPAVTGAGGMEEEEYTYCKPCYS